MIVIATPALIPHDAVGNDVRGMHATLARHYPDVAIYATQTHPDGYSEPHLLSQEDFFTAIERPDTLLIYHHSIHWPEGDAICERAKCRMVLKYHNITPPHFFAPYNTTYAKACELGRAQTALLAQRAHAFWADSAYNAAELQALGAKDVAIIPPFHKIEDFHHTPIDTQFAAQILAHPLNILFVGRFAPNKGHLHLLRTIACYKKKYTTPIHLHIAGALDRQGLDAYIKYIDYYIHRLDLQDSVTIYDKLSFAKLVTLYSTSHIFLLLSEHEGFCVPILEAQLSKLPIIALDRAAVAETMGDEQLVFKELDYEKIADAIHLLHTTYDYRAALIRAGQRNLTRFALPAIRERLLAQTAKQLSFFSNL